MPYSGTAGSAGGAENGDERGGEASSHPGHNDTVLYAPRPSPGYDKPLFAVAASKRRRSSTACSALMWNAIRSETRSAAADEPMLSSMLFHSVLGHATFERALAFVLSNRLGDSTLRSIELIQLIEDVLVQNAALREAAVADLVAVRERMVMQFRHHGAAQRSTASDQRPRAPLPACPVWHHRDMSCRSFASALINYKGYHALQAHRVAHALWQRGQQVLALAFQSRMSEVFAIDIHPGARIGRGLMLHHGGTGCVIGETAVVGNNVTMMQGVTLGGTGKESGDRHPKVADGVLIGARAIVLGNIRVGRGAEVAARSLVLKPVPNFTLVAGAPAQEVGRVTSHPRSPRGRTWRRRSIARACVPRTPYTRAAAFGEGGEPLDVTLM